MSEDLTLEQISLLVSLAEIGEQSQGYVYSTSDVHINKLFSLGLIRTGTPTNPSQLKKGNDFYMISEKGKGLVYALVDHSNDLLRYWEKRQSSQTNLSQKEKVLSHY